MNPFLRAPLLVQTELILTAASQNGFDQVTSSSDREYFESAILLALATLDFQNDANASNTVRIQALHDGLIVFAQAWLNAGPRPLHHGLAVNVILNYPDAITAFRQINSQSPHTDPLAPLAGVRLDVLHGDAGSGIINAAVALAEAL